MITKNIINHLLDNHIETKHGLAKMLEVTPHAINNYIYGNNEMNPTKLMNLCKVYGLNINNFQDND